jgi:hypothetical protein
MRPLYRLLRGLKARCGDGKEPLPDEVREALEKFVRLSHALSAGLKENAAREQREATERQRDV